MMHVYYCIKCKRYRYTNNIERAKCCDSTMYYIDVDFVEFTKMSLEERKLFLQIYSLAN